MTHVVRGMLCLLNFGAAGFNLLLYSAYAQPISLFAVAISTGVGVMLLFDLIEED